MAGAFNTPPASGMEMDEDLTFAPRRGVGHRVRMTEFLHDSEDAVKYEFLMADKRLGYYEFDKKLRTVKVYSVESGEKHEYGDPFLFLPAKDWSLFYKRIWKDVQGFCDVPLYVGEWNGVTRGMRYRVVANQCKKKLDECVYIFTCRDASKISERTWPIPEDEHNNHYDLQFIFQWRDVRVLGDIFAHIDKMFRWCKMRDQYNSVRVKLFDPRGSMAETGELPTPPTYYKH